MHSCHSGQNHDLPFLKSRDCYSEPEAVYRTAKARGMDLVTITDHDSIDGCLEFLSRHPDASDFIVGEEISCWTPDVPIEVHLGAYGMTERAHRDIQPLRRNAFDVIAYLREQGIFFALNHLFHFYTGQVPMAQYLALLDVVPALETRNGAMLPAHNRLIEWLMTARLHVGTTSTTSTTSATSAAGTAGATTVTSRHAVVAGSDAHTLRRVGRTWTSVPARNRDEFLVNLAAGLGRAEGDEGGTVPLAADIYGVIAQYWLSLVGLRRHDLSWPRRAFGLGFSLVSAPFEFTPFAIAALKKSSEARRVRAYAALLERDGDAWAAIGRGAGGPYTDESEDSGQGSETSPHTPLSPLPLPQLIKEERGAGE